MRAAATVILPLLLAGHCVAEQPEGRPASQVAQPATQIDEQVLPSSLKTSGRVFAMSRHLGRKSVQILLPEPKGPAWADDEANPPLSAIDAIKLGIRKRQEIFPDTGAYAWHLTGAELKPWDTTNGFWYWQVSFDYKINDESGLVERPATSDRLCIIVLMNGEIVEPKVTRRDRQAP